MLSTRLQGATTAPGAVVCYYSRLRRTP